MAFVGDSSAVVVTVIVSVAAGPQLMKSFNTDHVNVYTVEGVVNPVAIALGSFTSENVTPGSDADQVPV